MHEMVPTPISPDQTPPSESATTVTPLAPLPPMESASRRRSFVEAVLAWPRAILRHPFRSLTIAGLVLLIAAGMGVAGVWLWAQHHLRAGRAALERYHTGEAIAHLTAARRVWPRDPELLLLAARAARRAGAFEAANSFLDLYQEQRKDDPELILERICLRAERGEPQSVANYCRTLVEQNDPDAPLVLEALAQGYARIYQPHQSEGLLNIWLQLEPDNPQALYIQGQIYDIQARHSDATRSFRAALEVDPTLDEARLRLCDALIYLGSFEEAQPHVEFLSRRLPDSPKVQVYLALIQDRQGHSEEAERILDGVLAHHPLFGPALLERGRLALRAGQLVEAEKYLREAVQQDPGSFQARDRLAFCLEQNGKLAEADKERERISQMEKDLLEIQEIARGRLEQKPHDADMHYQIGMISMRAGAVTEGLRWLNSALKEDPNHQGAHKALMEHYQRVGDFVKAREHRQKLIK
jgi:tetratricopeptide (TPR) repeat protein